MMMPPKTVKELEASPVLGAGAGRGLPTRTCGAPRPGARTSLPSTPRASHGLTSDSDD